MTSARRRRTAAVCTGRGAPHSCGVGPCTDVRSSPSTPAGARRRRRARTKLPRAAQCRAAGPRRPRLRRGRPARDELHALGWQVRDSPGGPSSCAPSGERSLAAAGQRPGPGRGSGESAPTTSSTAATRSRGAAGRPPARRHGVWATAGAARGDGRATPCGSTVDGRGRRRPLCASHATRALSRASTPQTLCGRHPRPAGAAHRRARRGSGPQNLSARSAGRRSAWARPVDHLPDRAAAAKASARGRAPRDRARAQPHGDFLRRWTAGAWSYGAAPERGRRADRAWTGAAPRCSCRLGGAASAARRGGLRRARRRHARADRLAETSAPPPPRCCTDLAFARYRSQRSISLQIKLCNVKLSLRALLNNRAVCMVPGEGSAPRAPIDPVRGQIVSAPGRKATLVAAPRRRSISSPGR